MSSTPFDEQEIEYMRSQPLARLATVAPDGQPDVVPVAFEFDGRYFWVGGGETFLATRKVGNLRRGNTMIGLVIDDMVSFNPFIARGIRVYGTAEEPVEREGIVGPGYYIRIIPVISWSWNMEGKPVGHTWYSARKILHK